MRLNLSEPTILHWEGVLQYLQPNAVDSVLCTIAKRAKGTVLVFTYVLQELISGVYRCKLEVSEIERVAIASV